MTAASSSSSELLASPDELVAAHAEALRASRAERAGRGGRDRAAPLVEAEGLGIWFRRTRRPPGTLKRLLLGGGRGAGSDVLWALRDVSFRLHEGESLGIVGPNGAGKSTLCLTLARILEPDEGRVQVRGRVATLLALGRGFNAELTGRENVRLAAAFLGVARAELARRMDEIIGFAELGDAIDEPLRTYSTGMRARLGFAVATALEPEILILDEVLSVGDRAFRARSRARMLELIARSRLLVVVSHSSAFLRTTCTHALWLDAGRVRAFGPAAETLDAYDAAMGGEDAVDALDDA